MATPASKRARLAAGVVCAVFVPFVLIHLLWAAGITWGLEAMFGDWTGGSGGLTFASLVGAAAGAAVIYVTISRVGWHRTRLPDRLLQLGNWVVFAWPAIGTLNPSTTWGMRAVTVPLAIAAFVVARPQPRPAPVLARGRRLVARSLRPGHRAAVAAAAGCAAYGSLKLYWALGGGLLLREAPLAGAARRDLLEHSANMVALNSASAALAVIGIALALATVRERRLPRQLVVWLPALVGGLMLMRAGLSAAGDVAELSGAGDGSTYTARWDLILWSPFFAVWGAAWVLAAVAAHRRIGARPPRPARREVIHGAG